MIIGSDLSTNTKLYHSAQYYWRGGLAYSQNWCIDAIIWIRMWILFYSSVLSSGFGFYPSKDWEIFSSLRKRGGLGRGNYSDEDVCSMIGTYWDMPHPEDREEFCRPQWVGDWSGGQVPGLMTSPVTGRRGLLYPQRSPRLLRGTSLHWVLPRQWGNAVFRHQL